MSVRRFVLLFSMMFLLVSACAPLETPAPTSEPPTVEPVQNSGFYPLDTMTQIEELDIILAAVASGDPQQVRDLFGYTATACMTVNALGGPPPCRAGEAEGTSVEVLPILGSEGSFLRREEAGGFPGLQVSGIYAVYEVSSSAYSEPNYPAGDYALAFVSDSDIPGVVLQVRDGRIIRIDYVFEMTSFKDRLERDASNFILPPNS